MVTPTNSVWTAMAYTPPRGRCNFKASLMSPGCACLRFMLHPVKAATSFECDGCSHHASYHSLENAAEDAIRAKWGEQESQRQRETQPSASGARKKRKAISQSAAADEDYEDDVVVLGSAGAASPSSSRGPAKQRAERASRGSR